MAVLRQERLEAADAAPTFFWRPGTVLAFFFAASLISAVFFGLGYSFGRRGVMAPARGSAGLVTHGAPGSRRAAGVAVGRDGAFHRHGSDGVAMAATRSDATDRDGHFMVQVDATGSRRRARRLVAELRRSGFQAEIHRGRHDRFLHVQIGPFRTPQEAAKVRHRVVESGYHAVLKRAS